MIILIVSKVDEIKNLTESFPKVSLVFFKTVPQII